MKPEIQLQLSAFDRETDPACGDRPDVNGFRTLCYTCPFSERRTTILFCTRFRKSIGARSQYGLRAWREPRDAIRKRDGNRCMICGLSHNLHIHHRDRDPMNDHPDNLITLCGYCHARVHAEELRNGGTSVVEAVLFSAVTAPEYIIRLGTGIVDPGTLPSCIGKSTFVR